ncbi:MAG: LamG domain protein jellyroll fold domain protein [Lacunisphaera sp.]|nr:LamG domain protein jellyroll fold domain protein [Lacunisphaera sp.]
MPYSVRLFTPSLALLLLGLLAPSFGHAQTAVINLNFDNPGDRLAQTGSASTSFSNYHAGLTFETGVNGGTAAVFDGASSLQASDTPLTSALTVSFWMKTTTDNGLAGDQWYNGAGLVDGELGGDTTDWGISQIGTQLAFGIGSSDTTILSTSNVNTGNWIHVAATWDTSGAMNLYFNGTLEATNGGASWDDRDTSNQFFIGQDLGADFDNPQQIYIGSLDEIQIYDSALSSGQITALAAIPEPATYAIFAGCGALGLALWRRRRAK